MLIISLLLPLYISGNEGSNVIPNLNEEGGHTQGETNHQELKPREWAIQGVVRTGLGSLFKYIYRLLHNEDLIDHIYGIDQFYT